MENEIQRLDKSKSKNPIESSLDGMMDKIRGLKTKQADDMGSSNLDLLKENEYLTVFCLLKVE